jgi:hypothetical protein
MLPCGLLLKYLKMLKARLETQNMKFEALEHEA